jgi:hypothetical protein
LAFHPAPYGDPDTPIYPLPPRSTPCQTVARTLRPLFRLPGSVGSTTNVMLTSPESPPEVVLGMAMRLPRASSGYPPRRKMWHRRLGGMNGYVVPVRVGFTARRLRSPRRRPPVRGRRLRPPRADKRRSRARGLLRLLRLGACETVAKADAVLLTTSGPLRHERASPRCRWQLRCDAEGVGSPGSGALTRPL